MHTLKNELKDRLLTYIGGGFGLVAGLAWNDAIKSLIEYVFPLSKDSLPVRFLYALVITVLAVVIVAYLARILGSKEDSPDAR
ncbi:MAG: DUF5654 family protein [Minisyncoccota bacterium]